MKLTQLNTAIWLATSLACVPVYSSNEIEELVVNADLRATELLRLPASVSVLTADQLQQQNLRHIEDVLNQAANVNTASGASRGRFIQIRGIGERGQFIEPVNFSVGVLVDGIDFTGISTAITNFDIQQVEILRGPQGTVYGANALAGLINLKSNPVADEFDATAKVELAEYNGRNFEAAVNIPVSESFGVRLAAQSNTSDGHTENRFLNRDDVEDIDESVFKAKLRWQASDQLQFQWTNIFADIDNGYDAFTLDNSGETLSDQPGTDAQDTFATALNTTVDFNNGGSLVANLSYADSEIEYSYDEDWTFVGICDGLACDADNWGFDWEYSSFDQYLRDNTNTGFDLRYSSAPGPFNWTAGVYYRDQAVDLTRNYTFAEGAFFSSYDTENLAVYGEISMQLSDTLLLTAGLRTEQSNADYSDSEFITLDNDESATGGKLSLQYLISDDAMIYALFSRGYKFGGFNPNNAIEPEFREFSSEQLNNLEFGYKSSFAEGKVISQIALFWQDRDDVQISNSNVNCAAEGPCQFDDYTDNAAGGTTLGLEAQLSWQATDAVTFYSNLGLMDSQFDDYVSFTHIDADPDNDQGVDLDGRELPHAPSYTVTMGVDLAITERLNLDINVVGKDEFYFSNDHDERSDAYELVNARLDYQLNNVQLSLWGTNLTDEEYQVRGFGSFPNDPRNFYAGPFRYVQLGAPRVVGISAEFRFQ